MRTSRRYGAALLTVVIGLLVARPAYAQWDVPSFFSPGEADDIGLYVVNPDRGDVGFFGMWRQTGNINLGVRAGVEGSEGNRAILVGVELFNSLDALRASLPLDLSWNVGVGASFSDAVTFLRIPFGVSAGRTFAASPSLLVTPYVHPRIALDLVAFDDAAGEEQTHSEANFVLDVGADVALGQSFVLKVGASLGAHEAIGLGVSYRLRRAVVVR